MYSPKQFKSASQTAPEKILQELQKEMVWEDRVHYIAELLSSTPAIAESLPLISTRWMQIIQDLQRELLTNNERIQMTVKLCKSRLNSEYHSNVNELHEVLDRFVILHNSPTPETFEVFTDCELRVNDIYGNLVMGSLSEYLEHSNLLTKQINEQQTRAQATLTITQKILEGINTTTALQV